MKSEWIYQEKFSQIYIKENAKVCHSYEIKNKHFDVLSQNSEIVNQMLVY